MHVPGAPVASLLQLTFAAAFPLALPVCHLPRWSGGRRAKPPFGKAPACLPLRLPNRGHWQQEGG